MLIRKYGDSFKVDLQFYLKKIVCEIVCANYMQCLSFTCFTCINKEKTYR